GTYFEGAQFVHFLLGPATVSLALPLFDNLGQLRRAALPVAAALLAGSATAAALAVAIACALGVRGEALASVAPKSATAPFAMGIDECIRGASPLPAVLWSMPDIPVSGLPHQPRISRRSRGWLARVLSLGVPSHGLGTARAFLFNPTAGAWAGLGMAPNAAGT